MDYITRDPYDVKVLGVGDWHQDAVIGFGAIPNRKVEIECPVHGKQVQVQFRNWAESTKHACPACLRIRDKENEHRRDMLECMRGRREAWKRALQTFCEFPGSQFYTFDGFNVDEANADQRRARTFTQKFAQRFFQRELQRLITKREGGNYLEENRMGLILSGGVGTGKTHLALAIFNELMAQGIDVLCFTCFEMLRRTFDGSFQNDKVMNAFKSCTCLIIDELGAFTANEEEQRRFCQIVNARYQNGLPTVVVTNLSKEDMEAGGVDQRSRERLFERSVLVKFNWKSHRAPHKSFEDVF